MLKLYVGLSALLFLFLGVIWSRVKWFNLLLKLVFFGLCLLGLFNVLVLDGYLVRVP